MLVLQITLTFCKNHREIFTFLQHYGRMSSLREGGIYMLIEALSETMISFLSTLLSAFTGVSVSVIELFYKKRKLLANEKKQQDILSQKIDKLTQSLHESSQLMTEIEAEFDRQKKLAEKWKEEAATSQVIAALNQDEIDAVTKLLGRQLEKESKKSGRQSWWWSLFFCILGIVGGYVIARFFPAT